MWSSMSKFAAVTLVSGILTAYLLVHILTPMAATVVKQFVKPFSIVYITTPTQEVARKIARGLVENQLAACVNIIPSITSIYKWEGKIEEDSELLLMVKTRTQKVDELITYVKANHPYSVPEIISTPIESGHDLYLKFINDSIPEKS